MDALTPHNRLQQTGPFTEPVSVGLSGQARLQMRMNIGVASTEIELSVGRRGICPDRSFSTSMGATT
jgi:hypothetical protein